jgi:hypothetical protein
MAPCGSSAGLRAGSIIRPSSQGIPRSENGLNGTQLCDEGRAYCPRRFFSSPPIRNHDGNIGLHGVFRLRTPLSVRRASERSARGHQMDLNQTRLAENC